MNMISGFYNINPFTPSPLVVITKDAADNHQMLYPDGHLEELTIDEFRELETEFVRTEQKKIWEREPFKTKFVLLPDGIILAGTNAEVCSELIRWYKSSKKDLDESTRRITEKYISFLLNKLRKDDSELKNVRESMLPLFIWFLIKTQNIELAEWFVQLSASQGYNATCRPVSIAVRVLGKTSIKCYTGRAGKIQNRGRYIYVGSVGQNEEKGKTEISEDDKVKFERRKG